MSHFTVLVAADNETQLQERLIPFYEYGCSRQMDELVQPWLVFDNVEKECRAEYETGTVKRVILPDGEQVSPYDERWIVAKEGGDLFSSREYVVPSEYAQRDVKFSEVYPTLEAFIEQHHGYTSKPTLGYGRWFNPNAKWDWYSVGGRWNGILALKNGNSADNALAGDVNWKLMEHKCVRDARRDWAQFDKALTLVGETAETFLQKTQDERHVIIDSLRAALYNNGSKSPDSKMSDRYIRVVLFEPMGKTRTEHIEAFRNRALTYAFIDTKGEWHARGKMGWWAMSYDEKDNYNADFWAFINSLDPAQMVYVVDCHI